MIEFKKRLRRSKGYADIKVYDKDDVLKGTFTEEYVHWKELNPESKIKWALGDDGYIGQVESIKIYKVNRFSKKDNLYVRLSYGGNFVRKNSKLLFLPHYRRGCYGPINPNNWQEALVRKARIQFVAKVAARMMLNGKVDYERIGKLYRPDHRVPEWTGRKFVKITKVKELIMAEVDVVLKESGLDKEFISSSAKKMIDMAMDNKDLKAGAKLLEIAGKWLAMDAPKVKETNQFEQTMISQIGETIQQSKLLKQQTMEGQVVNGKIADRNDREVNQPDRLGEQ